MSPKISLALLLCVACGERPLEPRDPTPGVAHYKFQTFNVEAGDDDDPATVSAVSAGDADIVALQETTPAWEAVLRDRYAEKYPYQIYNRPDSGAAGLGIISRFPIEDGGWHPSPVGSASNGWYPAWHVNVATPAGRVQILNVHLRSAHNGQGNAVKSYLATGADHVAQIAAFVNECAGGTPTVVLGDFNEGINGAAIEYLEADGFQNALWLYHPGQFTWRHGSVANQFTQTLDHVLFDQAFEPLNSWVVDVGHSDHLPVVAHLEAAYTWELEAPSLRTPSRR